MIPTPRKWNVTFRFTPEEMRKNKLTQPVVSVVVDCVKRFAVQLANEQIGYKGYFAEKITVGLVK